MVRPPPGVVVSDRQRHLGTERKRRLRARQRRGAIVVRCEVPIEVIGLLVDLGWLRISESEDRNEIALAIMAAIGSALDAKVCGTRGQQSGS